MSSIKYIGTSFDEMTTEEMEDVFGGANEISPNSTPISSYLVSKVTISIISGSLSAISGIVSYNKSCLG